MANVYSRVFICDFKITSCRLLCDCVVGQVVLLLVTGHVLVHVTRGAESSLPVAHPGYQVLSDILFRLGLIANALTQCSS